MFFGEPVARAGTAADLIDERTVMSPAEFKKAAQWVKDDGGRPGAAAIAKTLKARIDREPVSDAVRDLVRGL